MDRPGQKTWIRSRIKSIEDGLPILPPAKEPQNYDVIIGYSVDDQLLVVGMNANRELELYTLTSKRWHFNQGLNRPGQLINIMVSLIDRP